MDEAHEIECRECDGYGFTIKRNPNPLMRGLHEITCEACNGHGWRAMTDDEQADAAEEQFRELMAEPPVSLDEQHRAAWDQKQELRK